jgi:hypothetical protein
MSTQYPLVQSGETASGGFSAGQVSSEPVAPRIYYIFFHKFKFYGMQIWFCISDTILKRTVVDF